MNASIFRWALDNPAQDSRVLTLQPVRATEPPEQIVTPAGRHLHMFEDRHSFRLATGFVIRGIAYTTFDEDTNTLYYFEPISDTENELQRQKRQHLSA